MVCSNQAEFSCQNLCGNAVRCGNHFCTKSCHSLVAESCDQCTQPCRKVIVWTPLITYYTFISLLMLCNFRIRKEALLVHIRVLGSVTLTIARRVKFSSRDRAIAVPWFTPLNAHTITVHPLKNSNGSAHVAVLATGNKKINIY